MKHTDTIEKLIKTVRNSQNFHGCLIEGPAGWGKTTSAESALSNLKVPFVSLGSYSTPLSLFNFLYQHSSEFVLLDDVSGVFSSPLAMAILKAATWPRHSSGKRVVTWVSTTMKADIDEFEFKGKLLVICNSFPKTADAEAIKSRLLGCKIYFSNEQKAEALLEAGRNTNWFQKTDLSLQVAKYLTSKVGSWDGNISYRTLKMGYELALHNRDWKDLLLQIMPEKNLSCDPKQVVSELNLTGIPVEKQLIEFEKRTGLKRRSFYKFRKELRLSRPYREQSFVS